LRKKKNDGTKLAGQFGYLAVGLLVNMGCKSKNILKTNQKNVFTTLNNHIKQGNMEQR
jgi:hypothetical protein